MKTTRREFVKLSAGAISVTCLLPVGVQARRQEPLPVNENRRILVVVQLSGGNDGLNTIIPYTDSRYHQLRPTLGFREEELKDSDGNSTIINSEFGFHPSLKELKELYTQSRLAVVLGVGYPDTDLSHEVSTKIWQSANINQGLGTGWVGRYADLVFDDQANLPAVAIGELSPPKIISSERVNIPLIARLGASAFEAKFYPLLRENIVSVFRDTNNRVFPPGSFIERVASTGAKAENNSGLLESVLDAYNPSVTYPEDNNAAQALKSVAVLVAAFPEASVFHVSYPSFFDTHASQIGSLEDQFRNKRIGAHAIDLKRISQAIKLFYDDMTGHGLGENVVLMTYSEFGRRPNENGSNGTDHGSASNLFVVGNKVKGGDIYGLQPSLKATDFDIAGNMRITTDFRSVYATLIDKWLPGGDSTAILGERFPHLGFL